MTSMKTLLKVLFMLFLWTIAIIEFLKTHVNNNVLVQQDFAEVNLQGQILKPNKTIATDRFDTSDLLVDKRTAMDEEQIARDDKKRFPSLPIVYWSQNKTIRKRKNITCARYPTIIDLEFNNIYWQTMHTSNATLHLYSAHYDERKRFTMGPVVRILGMINNDDTNLDIFCQFWFDIHKQRPAIVQNFEHISIWSQEWGDYKQSSYQPKLITCKIPNLFRDFVPSSVSLVAKECDTATNNLRVIYNRPPDNRKKGFAVCVRGLNPLYEDISVRLIEWIEMLNILGAEKIYFYSLHLHPNVSKVLSHYEQSGKVEVMPLMLPGGQPNVPRLQRLFINMTTYLQERNEIIPYNDCFFKNLYLYNYITVLDIDEIIMPNGRASNWAEVLETVKREEFRKFSRHSHSYRFQSFFFLDSQQHEHDWHKGIPKFMHMLQHVHRANKSDDQWNFIKCFHDTQHVLFIHKHYPLICFAKNCTTYAVDAQIARMHHYSTDCVGKFRNCSQFRDNAVEDKTIWNYKDELINRSLKTLNTLGFLKMSKS